VVGEFLLALGNLGLPSDHFSGRRVFGEHPARIAALIFLFFFFP
jgi:hypothetical protein